MAYFDRLNYTLANEDTRVEHEFLPMQASSVFSVSGSGARVLPLVARNPARLVVNDLVQEQLYLCELRIAAARTLNGDEFLFFMGYRGGLPAGNLKGDDRRDLFKRLGLSSACAEFWKQHEAIWLPRGFVFVGKWESHFKKISRIFETVVPMNVRAIFEAHSLNEQIALYEKHWKPRLFRSFLRMVANEFVFNRFLYKGHFAGNEGHRTEARAPWKFLDDEFRRLFTTTLVRKSYFLQMLFLGGIYYEEGLPFEAHASTLAAIRESQTEITYAQGDLLELLAREAADFYSLSDVISYLPGEAAEGILSRIVPAAPSGSLVVIRSFLRAPGKIRTDGWMREKELDTRAFELDCTGVYEFHIFRKT